MLHNFNFRDIFLKVDLKTIEKCFRDYQQPSSEYVGMLANPWKGQFSEGIG
jgi:hypothetical protein